MDLRELCSALLLTFKRSCLRFAALVLCFVGTSPAFGLGGTLLSGLLEPPEDVARRHRICRPVHRQPPTKEL